MNLFHDAPWQVEEAKEGVKAGVKVRIEELAGAALSLSPIPSPPDSSIVKPQAGLPTLTCLARLYCRRQLLEREDGFGAVHISDEDVCFRRQFL